MGLYDERFVYNRNDQHKAISLLVKYLRCGYEAAGNEWTDENEDEVVSIVNSILCEVAEDHDRYHDNS